MSTTPARISVRATRGFEAAADDVARALGLPREGDEPPDLSLVLDERGWSLTDGAPGTHPVRADFTSAAFARRLRDVHRGEARLAHALGLRRHAAPLVLDATAGLGRETVLSAALGCEVIACERSPIVALLLRDALDRAAAGGLASVVARIGLRTGDAREILPTLQRPPDVVLVDPMFPERRKTAKAGREMQILQRLLGPDEDAGALLDAVLAHARRRVVVKRAVHAPPVGGREPSHRVEGRASRYDVYIVPPEGEAERR